jgi:hypothetical protein
MKSMASLTGGTEITMADGSKKAIESIKVGDVVKGQPHNSTVTDTSLGRSSSPLIKIETNNGSSLIATEGHPVATTNGMVTAAQLTPGTSVITTQGPTNITGITSTSYNGNLFSLHLAKGTDPSSSFYANGLLIGNSEMHQKQTAKPLYDINARLPQQWHQDIADRSNDDPKK